MAFAFGGFGRLRAQLGTLRGVRCHGWGTPVVALGASKPAVGIGSGLVPGRSLAEDGARSEVSSESRLFKH